MATEKKKTTTTAKKVAKKAAPKKEALPKGFCPCTCGSKNVKVSGDTASCGDCKRNVTSPDDLARAWNK